MSFLLDSIMMYMIPNIVILGTFAYVGYILLKPHLDYDAEESRKMFEGSA